MMPIENDYPCQTCGSLALTGQQFCTRSECWFMSCLCVIHGCTQTRFPGALVCLQHLDLFQDSGIESINRWAATLAVGPGAPTLPLSLPVPTSVTTHGLPPGEDDTAVHAALVQAGLNLQQTGPTEDDTEIDLNSVVDAAQSFWAPGQSRNLDPECMYISSDGSWCQGHRAVGIPFCVEHAQEGYMALGRECVDPQNLPAVLAESDHAFSARCVSGQCDNYRSGGALCEQCRATTGG